MQSKINKSSLEWVVYIVECSDESLYTGITNNLPKRFRQHCSLRGAKYFFARQPVRIVYAEAGFDRSSAGKREFEIKRMRRDEKLLLIQAETENSAKIIPEI